MDNRALKTGGVVDNSITWLILLRMRIPLLVLISAYGISVLGMVLVPGNVVDGQVTHLDFFHAVYFVSYVATTIGFGELPIAFSDPQRFWAIVTMYLCVISWIYSIGAILTLVQDPAFRQILQEHAFARQVNKIKQPFFLICGYGETGQAMTATLTHYSIPIVVIDNDPNRINELALHSQLYKVYVPGLCADVSEAGHLVEAGIRHPLCSRVIALTGDDRTNLHIAITSKLLNPSLKVICRSLDQAIADNMSSFGTEFIFDPFKIFAHQLSQALHTPGRYLIYLWLTGIAKSRYQKPTPPPPRGLWIICGYGRFGRILNRKLNQENIETVVIEPHPVGSDLPANLVCGNGTEAPNLLEARVKEAVGIVAGSDNDANNLSIIMTAREINPDIYTVARENKQSNKALFEALNPHLILHHAQILATNISCLLTSPMLAEFLYHIHTINNHEIGEIINRLESVINKAIVPDIWSVNIQHCENPIVTRALEKGLPISISNIMQHPFQRGNKLTCISLVLQREEGYFTMPDADSLLQINDRLLFCGIDDAYQLMQLLLHDEYILEEILLNKTVIRSLVMRKLFNQPDPLF